MCANRSFVEILIKWLLNLIIISSEHWVPYFEHFVPICNWSWAVQAGCHICFHERLYLMDHQHSLRFTCMGLCSWSYTNGSSDSAGSLALQGRQWQLLWLAMEVCYTGHYLELYANNCALDHWQWWIWWCIDASKHWKKLYT